MPRYEKAPAQAGQIIERMMERYHPQLRDANVKVDVLFAFATTDEFGDRKGSAVKLHGYSCKAVVRVLGLKDRTVGRGDAEIVIDGDEWPTWPDDEKDALLDHELEHLELKTDKDGLVVRDDLDRPKLRIRKHDHQFGWFDSIARRHGSASLEIQQAQAFHSQYKQLWLPYVDKPDQTPVVAEAKSDESVEVDVRDDAESGAITSVTISAGGKSVTTTPKQMKKLATTLTKAAKRGHGGRRAAAGK